MLILYVLDVHEEAPYQDSTIRGRSPEWKDTFSIDEKGGDIYQIQRIEAWFQGEKIYHMQRTEADLSDIEDKGMVLGGA
jgi:hypothetical protein